MIAFTLWGVDVTWLELAGDLAGVAATSGSGHPALSSKCFLQLVQFMRSP